MGKVTLKEKESCKCYLSFCQHNPYIHTQDDSDKANSGSPSIYMSAKTEWHGIICIKIISKKQHFVKYFI